MPEQISRYPEVTIKILKEAGGRCGEGVEQKILKKCPPERFCSMPTGEVCVYGIEDIPMMTQISTRELARVVSPPGQLSPAGSPPLPAFQAAPLLAAFAAGVVAGALGYRFGRGR
jgi:hypothetical protein